MATKTIGITEDVYDRLKARKRAGESFTELVDRLLDEARPDWRSGFGTLSEDEATELNRVVEESRASLGRGLATRQDRTKGTISAEDEPDETP